MNKNQHKSVHFHFNLQLCCGNQHENIVDHLLCVPWTCILGPKPWVVLPYRMICNILIITFGFYIVPIGYPLLFTTWIFLLFRGCNNRGANSNTNKSHWSPYESYWSTYNFLHWLAHYIYGASHHYSTLCRFQRQQTRKMSRVPKTETPTLPNALSKQWACPMGVHQKLRIMP